MNADDLFALVQHFYTPVSAPRPRQRTAASTRPRLEALEDRLVPSAAPLDLTTAGANGTIGGVLYEQVSTQPTGTGVIHSFLRLQAQSNPVEQGYNTDARPLEFDEKTSATFTHALKLSDLPAVTVNGVTYRVMLLDINQDQAQPMLSLDELRVYVADSANLSGYDATAHTLGGKAPVFDQTADGDNWVKLNSGLNHGSGSGDMLLFVPESVLAAGGGNPYVYLYSKFGMQYAANGGFEEWAPAAGRIPLPPGPAQLSGFVYFDANQSGALDATDAGISGVVLTLTGTNDLGQAVTLTATTAADGSYSFTGLRPGTYTITETQPNGFQQGQNSVGTVNGVTDGTNLGNDVLGGIVLQFGQTGLNYNFGEFLPASNS